MRSPIFMQSLGVNFTRNTLLETGYHLLITVHDIA